MLRLIAGVVLAAALVTGSRSGIGPVRQPAPTPVEYRPDAVLDEYRPAAPARGASAVLLVHGCCGDRRDLAAMARAIARRGVHVLNADVRAFHRGGGWPQTYSDVVCAYATARRLADSTASGTPVAVVGWDDGALVASAVALGWRAFASRAADCTVPLPSDGPSLVIGLSGHYGWVGDIPSHMVTAETIEWFGGDPDERPVAWAEGNPGWWLDRPVERLAELSFLLLDTGVVSETERFGAALRARRLPAEVHLIGDGSHDALILPRNPDGAEALDIVVAALQPGSWHRRW